jgi:hypothetical protein
MDIRNSLNKYKADRPIWQHKHQFRLLTYPPYIFVSLFVNLLGMEEVIFLVEESVEGGFTAKGMGISIFTDANTLEELRERVKDAVHCHFDDDKKRIIRLHVVREEVFAA